MVQRADPEGSGQGLILQGYARGISGERLSYHSPLPGQRQALLTRARAGWDAIVWETEPVPRRDDATQSECARFTWLAGLGCNLGDALFLLRVGDRAAIEFRTQDQERWTQSGPQGCVLTFRGVMRDHYGDRFGFMLLDVPWALLSGSHGQRDERLRLEIVGLVAGQPTDGSADAAIGGIGGTVFGSQTADDDSAATQAEGSLAWVMTFEEPLAEGVVLTAPPVLLRSPEGETQPVDVSVLHLGAGTEIEISAPERPVLRRDVPFGFTTVRYGFPPVSQTTPCTLQISVGSRTIHKHVQLEPVRPWTIHLVHHTHTDIGYTRPQTEILGDHLRYIDYALDFCDATDTYPDEARFRWTCEVSWPIREYLRVRPAAQIERLKRRVRAGRIELTAMPLNLGEVAGEVLLASSLRWIADTRAAGLPVRVAMQNDVNGFPWSLIDAFQDLGVAYVWMGEHTHRALEPFEMPTPFWWESPSGKRVLAYRAEHYMTANFWGILGGDRQRFASQLFPYLRDLAAKGYPYDDAAVQYVGYFTDNAPPSTFANELVRGWNEEYVWPRLTTSTAAGFLERFARESSPELAVHRAAWPDWWTDGFGSAMRETAVARRAQCDQIANQGLLAMARLLGEPIPAALLEQADAVDDLLIFYNEHTFGAAESISDPQCENSQVQWLAKASYVWQAVMQARLLREGALGILQSHFASGALPTVTVCNTLNWERSGPHTLFIDHQLLPRERDFTIEDNAGRALPMQWLSARAEGSYWALWAEDVPPLGFATYRLCVRDEARATPPALSGAAGERLGAAADGSSETMLENDWYRITVDAARGGIVSLFDKELDRELLDPARGWQCGQPIYERLASRAAMERYELGEHTRVSWSGLRVGARTDGPLWQSVSLRGDLEGFDGLRCEIRLYKTAKQIELIYSGRKLLICDPEALYVAFPFALPDGELLFEAQGGEVRPGIDQLAGTASDWNTVQSYAVLRSPLGQIILVSDEAPLMQFGDINTGRYEYEGRPASNRIFSWVLNNYWVTNFRASQEGELRWSYLLSSEPDARAVTAARFGWGARIPFVSRVRPPTDERRRPAIVAAPDLDREDLLLLCATPETDGDGVQLHLRAIGGAPVTLERWAPAGWEARRCNAQGREIETIDALRLNARESCFVRLRPQRPR